MKKSRLVRGLPVLLAAAAYTPAFASTIYDITMIGLTGTEHTRNDGYRFSYVQSLNEAGQAVGYAERYNGGRSSLGQSVWLYTGTSTVDLSLTGIEHTRNDGYRYSAVQGMNEAGQAAGYAERYDGGGTNLGKSAWLYTGTSTVDLSLTGVEHTRNDGYRESRVRGMNEAGQAVGYAQRYNGGGTYLGLSTWLYTGTSTVDLSLTGVEHTSNDGFRISVDLDMNEAGQVAGFAYRYNGGGTYLGQSAWLYTGTSTVDLSLTGVEHTRNDGYRVSYVQSLNEAGQGAGFAYRFYGGGTYLGQSAWLYTGTSTVDLSLTGVEHTRNDGYRSSYVSSLNEAGQVAGYAERYNGGGTNLGNSAWLYTGTSTVDLSLTGIEHTRNDGYRSSYVWSLNEAGQVVGYAERYNGGRSSLGQSAWLYTGTSTVDLSLTGIEHTRNDGYRVSYALGLNEAGQAVGYAERYNGGGTSLGQSVLFYDSTLDQIFSMDFSVRSTDGYAYSAFSFLGDDGLGLGYYNLFDTDGTSLGNRAFSFTVEDGFLDLGSLIADLSGEGWLYLASAIRANGAGQIIGTGLLGDMTSGSMAYLLTPSAVPIPPTVWLFGSGLVGLMSIARRKRAG